jgi:hypothetical protein
MSADLTRLLFGPYVAPPFEYGAIVRDEVRGDVEIVALSDAPIPWPIGCECEWGVSRSR